MRRFILILISCLATVSAAALNKDDLERALRRLDSNIATQNIYIAARQARIDSLHRLLDAASILSDSLPLISNLAEEFTSFNNDSAIYYHRCVYLLSDGENRIASRLRMGALLPLAGFNEKATGIYEKEFSPDTLSAPLRRIYYEGAAQMYSYVGSAFAQYREYSDYWKQKSADARRALVTLLPRDSQIYKLNLGECYLNEGQLTRAAVILADVIDKEPENSNIRARAASLLSKIAEAEGDNDRRIYYLALSATSDVLSATREITSLQDLGEELNQRGDVERAYSYLSAAMDNSVACRASLRMVESSLALPIIQHTYRADVIAWRNRNTWIILALVIVILLLGVALIFIYRDMQRMSALHSSLRQANNLKEVYISRFLSLCSIYMDKLNQFCKIANRKISTGNIDDLYRMTKSGRFIEEQSKEFYDVFDDAFLHICPTFVRDVNALLRPDAQIVLAEGEMLNTDLRILAFMRLGIDDSSRIAQVLNYSLNTVYAYRNRLKSRAISRDTFEDDIRNIGK